jgi:hypothetical protein
MNFAETKRQKDLLYLNLVKSWTKRNEQIHHVFYKYRVMKYIAKRMDNIILNSFEGTVARDLQPLTFSMDRHQTDFRFLLYFFFEITSIFMKMLEIKG